MYTIHNLNFQGLFSKEILSELLDFPYDYYDEEKLKFYDSVSFMKAGIVYSDFVNTVSKTYAEEIKTSFYGEGLDGLFKKYEDKFTGILNGVDYDLYNPSKDENIYIKYNSNSFDLKSENKLHLQKELGLTEDEKIPLISIVGRLTKQKGLDLVIAMVEEILKEGAQLVILGTGENKYEEVY